MSDDVKRRFLAGFLGMLAFLPVGLGIDAVAEPLGVPGGMVGFLTGAVGISLGLFVDARWRRRDHHRRRESTVHPPEPVE
jgi:hypothetical protein